MSSSTAATTSEKAAIVDSMTMNALKYLNEHDEVAMVQVIERNGVSSSDIAQWEHLNYPLKMPIDLKEFLSVSDGIWIRWRAKFTEYNLGNIHVNSLSQLKPPSSSLSSSSSSCNRRALQRALVQRQRRHEAQYQRRRQYDRQQQQFLSRTMSVESMFNASGVFDDDDDGGGGAAADVDGNDDDDDDDDNDDADNEHVFPALVEIDDMCLSYGRTCLVYTHVMDMTPQVWFQDCACRWHYLAASFTGYFRLMCLHLGIARWQYVFTDAGMDEAGQQWLRLFVPERYTLNQRRRMDQSSLSVIPDLLIDDSDDDNDDSDNSSSSNNNNNNNDDDDDDDDNDGGYNHHQHRRHEALHAYRSQYRDISLDDIDKALQEKQQQLLQRRRTAAAAAAPSRRRPVRSARIRR